MTTLLIQAAGAGLGYALGPELGVAAATGGQYGWAAGGILAGLFGSNQALPPTFGPRLGDLKVQAATYGVAIPRAYACVRLAGNIIWTTDIIETATTANVESGGKGGGGSEQSQTTYSYSQSFAIGMCEGPIIGVRRIWANGKLIYSVMEGAETDTLIASDALNFTVYLGSETQVSSSLQESYLGAGNVPAYRGLAYVEFTDLPLGPYGNRTPNLEFEVVTAGAVGSGLALGEYEAMPDAVGTGRGVTSEFDSTDATLIIVVVGWFAAVGGVSDTVDNMGNAPRYTQYALNDSDTAVTVLVCENPITGPGHTITVNAGNQGIGIVAMCFSGGTNNGSPTRFRNITSHNDAGSQTISSGAITPSDINELLVTGLAMHPDTSLPIDIDTPSGFTVGGSLVGTSGNRYGAALAYKVSPPVVSVTPTWTWTGGVTSAAATIAIPAPVIVVPPSITPATVPLSTIVSDLVHVEIMNQDAAEELRIIARGSVLFEKTDGGRMAAGFGGHGPDCAVRAVALATGLSYAAVHAELTRRGAEPERGRCPRDIMLGYLMDIGAEWTDAPVGPHELPQNGRHVVIADDAGFSAKLELLGSDGKSGWPQIDERAMTFTPVPGRAASSELHAYAVIDGAIHDASMLCLLKRIIGYFTIPARA